LVADITVNDQMALASSSRRSSPRKMATSPSTRVTRQATSSWARYSATSPPRRAPTSTCPYPSIYPSRTARSYTPSCT
jgi:hypothetical protein